MLHWEEENVFKQPRLSKKAKQMQSKCCFSVYLEYSFSAQVLFYWERAPCHCLAPDLKIDVLTVSDGGDHRNLCGVTSAAG